MGIENIEVFKNTDTATYERGVGFAQATIRAGVYEHWRGQHYLVLGLADDSNNRDPKAEPQVVYVSLDAEGRTGRPLHVRSLSEFNDSFVYVGAGSGG